MERKIALPQRWATPVLKGLAKMKPLRGTKWDPFGYAEVRHVERALRDEYERTVLALAEAAGSATELDSVYQLAVAADDVRGYEDLKLRSGRELLAKLAEARRSWVAGVNLRDKVATPSL